jgi:hypothetical protein
MWLEGVLCIPGVSLSMLLHMYCIQCNEFIRLAPLSLAYAMISFLFLPEHFKYYGILFFIGIQTTIVQVIVGLLVITGACIGSIYVVWKTHIIHGGTRIIAIVAFVCLWGYFVLKALGADRDLLFIPILLVFCCTLWIWAVWERQSHGMFKMFVLGAMISHFIEMALFLVPHPPLKPGWIHLVPLLFSLLSPLFIFLRFHFKKSHDHWVQYGP